MSVGLGDAIELPTARDSWRVPIVGVYPDYGNPKGQIVVNTDQLVRRFPDSERTRFGVRVAPADMPALLAEIETRFGLDGNSLVDQATAKREARRVFTQRLRSPVRSMRLRSASPALRCSLAC